MVGQMPGRGGNTLTRGCRRAGGTWAGIALKTLPVQICDDLFLVRVGHDHKTPILSVAAARGLEGDLDDFLNHLRCNRARQVEPPPHRARGRQQFIDHGKIKRSRLPLPFVGSRLLVSIRREGLETEAGNDEGCDEPDLGVCEYANMCSAFHENSFQSCLRAYQLNSWRRSQDVPLILQVLPNAPAERLQADAGAFLRE